MKTSPPADPPFQNLEAADWAQNANLLLRLAQRTFNYNYMSWANWFYVGIQFGLGVSRFAMLPQVKAHYFSVPLPKMKKKKMLRDKLAVCFKWTHFCLHF